MSADHACEPVEMLKALSEYRKDPAAFLRLHEHPWLLWSPQRAPTSTSGNLDTPTRTVGTEMGTQRGPPGGRPLLFPICLKPGNPSERGVSIGRSSTSDITLTINQVSRVHAYFTPNGESLVPGGRQVEVWHPGQWDGGKAGCSFAPGRWLDNRVGRV